MRLLPRKPVWCQSNWDFDPVNVKANGSSISLCHPIGAAGGAVITKKLVHELTRTGGGYGLVTMCIGWGKALPQSVSVSNPVLVRLPGNRH